MRGIFTERGESPMKKKTWEKRIQEACEKAGTYRPFFNSIITTLAEVLEKRDEVEAYYKKTGALPLVEYTNKNGSTNLVKNPALIMWDDLSKTALAYWRDLGLTPAGLKRIDQTAMKEKKKNSLAEALKDLGS